MRKFRMYAFRASCLLLFFVVLIIATHHVSKAVTKEDMVYVNLYIDSMMLFKAQDLGHYDAQLSVIEAVQSKMLSLSPESKGIPKYADRRIKDIHEQGGGLCYDRSYAMQLILEYLGFKTRYIGIYHRPKGMSAIKVLSKKGNPSHAALEVKTQRGWLLVDPTFGWLALDAQSQAYSMMQIAKERQVIAWESVPPKAWYYTESSAYVYGLYSRHGKFHKPYTCVPDFNFFDLFYNF